ncbi:MAG: IS1595 family transposase [Saccharospirillaceae bacterium]|nr:IS1595 family transposase [Pseudomonadales bacterium]NRB80156.1 IS1595 family transposase [Saccharospirillaceae bacterium]
MSKNKIQFQSGYSLPQLFKEYGTPEQCDQALFEWKWPEGFSCPQCKSNLFCTLKNRKIYQCNQCHHQTSITSNTIFANTKLPLTTWFLGIYLLTLTKSGISALELKRQLGVSYNTAWSMKQKIMQVMKERDDQKPLNGKIQLHNVYWGGEFYAESGGSGSKNKTSFVAAVSTDEKGHPIAMNMNVVKGFQIKEIKRWAKQHVKAGSTVISDGLNCFKAVTKADCHHIVVVANGAPKSVQKEEFSWVNTMIVNVKNAIKGTYHCVDSKHLPRYLAEFCYRFNRRFDLTSMIPRFVYIALRTPPMPNRLLKLAELYG